jgi:hypothetical protein
MPSATTTATETQLMSGADILVKSLVDHGIEVLFAYPGGASMPLHQSLTKYKDQIRTILPRHEQGGGFAAQGYARSTGKLGVCVATSGPGGIHLLNGIYDATLDGQIACTERQGDHSETDRVSRSARPDDMIKAEIHDGGTCGYDRSSRNAADQHLPAKSFYVYNDVGE